MTTAESHEASAIRYNISRIVRLSTGRFAIFSPWTNDDGINLLHIGTLAEIEPFILSADECRDWTECLTKPTEGPTLLEQLGLSKPKPAKPFPRRI